MTDVRQSHLLHRMLMMRASQSQVPEGLQCDVGVASRPSAGVEPEGTVLRYHHPPEGFTHLQPPTEGKRLFGRGYNQVHPSPFEPKEDKLSLTPLSAKDAASTAASGIVQGVYDDDWDSKAMFDTLDQKEEPSSPGRGGRVSPSKMGGVITKGGFPAAVHTGHTALLSVGSKSLGKNAMRPGLLSLPSGAISLRRLPTTGQFILDGLLPSL